MKISVVEIKFKYLVSYIHFNFILGPLKFAEEKQSLNIIKLVGPEMVQFNGVRCILNWSRYSSVGERCVGF